MSAKKAKKIRREIKYHPADDRKYAQQRQGKRSSNSTLLIHPHDKRALYQEMKREVK